MACDLTLVLARSFKEVTFSAHGQPTERHLIAAARKYQILGYAGHVHQAVKQLVPRGNVLKSFRAEKIQQGLFDIFSEYKDKFLEDVDLPLDVNGAAVASHEADESATTDAGSSLFSDLKEDGTAVAELNGVPVGKHGAAELEASERAIAELPESAKIPELAHSASTVKRPSAVELAAGNQPT